MAINLNDPHTCPELVGHRAGSAVGCQHRDAGRAGQPCRTINVILMFMGDKDCIKIRGQ